MNETQNNLTSRRDFLKTSSAVTAATALAGPYVLTSRSATLSPGEAIQIALVGCGGRGTGAAGQALGVKNGGARLVAMADVFEDRLNSSYELLQKQGKESQLDVPNERKFIGFDAYKKAMDCLKPGDIAIFATPPGFRWVHFAYAIEKGLNVFMEKPVTVDGPSTRKMLQLAEESVKKNLKVGVGLMVRHCRARQELFRRLRDDAIGDIIALRAYRMHPPVVTEFAKPKPDNISELRYQVRNFHSFLWASGGLFSDFYIHQIDECCWMKNAWPVKAHALGGRHYRGDKIDQNFDAYSVEYTFEDGAKLFLEGRDMLGCHEEFASFAHGSKGSAIISSNGHTPGQCRIFRNQLANARDFKSQNVVWAFPQPERNPYDLEWEDLIDAIRNDKPYNEVKRGAEASLVTSMGRMAAHTGQVITFEDLLQCEHEFAPDLDRLTMDSPAPLQAGPDGKYPVPMPGRNPKREY
jgi:predicted dehydrogenase